VYNWQFVHSIHLWVQLLCSTNNSQHLEPLVYPVSQLITGCIGLVYTAKYYPMR
jgi:nucleolar complex protein 2